ncbi:MAG TPA: hypothetical protein VFN61_00060 [Acidimicrobiales bacterium]|nr:hypothetical protein [Acidimicrobiales bacterium]
MPSTTPTSSDLLEFACPRCRQSVNERFYGPCAGCRAELRSEQIGAGGAGDAGSGQERTRFEPKMNVVPNHVATKDD